MPPNPGAPNPGNPGAPNPGNPGAPNPGPPSSMSPQPGYADPAGPGNYAEAMSAKKSGPSFPVGFSAGGGLVIGVVAGLLLISGGGDAGEAVASNDTEVVDKAEVGETEDLDDGAEETGDETPGEEGVPAAAGDVIPEGEDNDPTADEKDDPTEEVAAGADVEVAVPAPVPVPVPAPVEVPAPTPEPDPIVAMLSFKVSPEEALPFVSITVDGEASSVDSISLTFAAKKTSKKVKVVATAEGYITFRRSFVVKGDSEMPIRLRKPAPAGTKPRKGRKGKGKGPGSSISL